jgi:hypothetical protein
MCQFIGYKQVTVWPLNIRGADFIPVPHTFRSGRKFVNPASGNFIICAMRK